MPLFMDSQGTWQFSSAQRLINVGCHKPTIWGWCCSTHTNGNDLGMVYYWLYCIIVDEGQRHPWQKSRSLLGTVCLCMKHSKAARDRALHLNFPRIYAQPPSLHRSSKWSPSLYLSKGSVSPFWSCELPTLPGINDQQDWTATVQYNRSTIRQPSSTGCPSGQQWWLDWIDQCIVLRPDLLARKSGHMSPERRQGIERYIRRCSKALKCVRFCFFWLVFPLCLGVSRSQELYVTGQSSIAAR